MGGRSRVRAHPRRHLPPAGRALLLETIPGVDAAWTILGLLELGVFVLIVVSLVRLEFMADRRKPFLLSGLGLAVFTFSIYRFGTWISDRGGTR